MKNTAFSIKWVNKAVRALCIFSLCASAVFFASKAEAYWLVYNQHLFPDSLQVGVVTFTDDYTSFPASGTFRAVKINLYRVGIVPDCALESPTAGVYVQTAVPAVKTTNIVPFSEIETFAKTFTVEFSENINFSAISYLTVGLASPCSLGGTNIFALGVDDGDDDLLTMALLAEGLDFVWSNYEENNNSNVADFEHWEVCLGFDADIFDPEEEYYINFLFNEGMDPAGGTTEDNSTLLFTGHELAQGTQDPGCVLIPKQNALDPNKLYSVLASVYNDSDEIIATSEILRFRTVAGDITFKMQPISKFVLDSEECKPTDFKLLSLDLGMATCKTIDFLFVPSSASTERITQTYDELTVAFPFAYVTDFKNAVEAQEEGSAELTTLALDLSETALPLGGAEGIEIFSAEKIEEFAGETNMTLLRSLMSGALWIALGFFMFHTVGRLH